MNIAVINLKDLIKYAVCFIVVIAIISIGISLLKKEELKEEAKENSSFLDYMKNSSFLYCLKIELPIISVEKEENSGISADIKSPKNILETELSILDSIEESGKTENTSSVENNILEENTVSNEIVENTETNDEAKENENIEVATNLETQVVSENNIKASYTDEGSNVQVNNQTGYDITDIINNPNYEIKNKTKFVIYHTHTCESYTSSDNYNYEMTGNYRTTDLNYTVSRVGDELAKCLEGYGKTVVHDKTFHDYPAYNGSYGRSLTTMQKVLESNQDAEIAIDLHRDAVRK